MAIKIAGINYVWKQATLTTGRAAIGGPHRKYRGWALCTTQKDASGHRALIAQVIHTHCVPTYVTPSEPPAWKVYVRVTKPDGTKVDGYLTHYREADPEELGDEGSALAKAKAKAEEVVRKLMEPKSDS